MFFRNTLIAHKKPIKPYFTGRVVLQAIIDCSDYIKMVTTPGKSRLSGAFFALIRLHRVLEKSKRTVGSPARTTTVKNSIRNCLTVFQNDPKLEGAIHYNILTELIDISKHI